jgi:hypothetical protein
VAAAGNANASPSDRSCATVSVRRLTPLAALLDMQAIATMLAAIRGLIGRSADGIFVPELVRKRKAK